MITKEQLTKLFHWGNKTTFPLRKEGITSKYMGYDVFVSYAKYGKNEKRYRTVSYTHLTLPTKRIV